MTANPPNLAEEPGNGANGQPPAVVRETVRNLLLSSASYHTLPAEQRRDIAQSLVKVCHTAVTLLQEEARNDQAAAAPPPKPVLALAQNAGSQFSGVSAERVAGTTRAILNAVSFPRFVTELINGVFKALVDSNQQQMQSYVELIRNVAATTDGFADMNLAPARARQWLVDTFPGSFELEGGADEDTDPRDADEANQEATVRLKSGASMPSEAALRSGLGLDPSESAPSGDPETSLVPFARRALARQRQQMLATMVMLGMQRIVIESGRLNASMRFHIDTRSTAASEDASRFDFQNKLEASGHYGVGIWGVEAKMTNTIGYVSTQKNQTTEEMNTDLDLNSSVELYFKTDYVPLDRLAGKGQVDRIKVNTLNPDAEEEAARKAREARTGAARTQESQRFSALDVKPLQPAPDTPAKPAAAAPAKQAPAAAPAKAPTKQSSAAPPPKTTKKTPGTP
jgi:hypothetical protein